jgi:undecaprenyl-diphosphatase
LKDNIKRETSCPLWIAIIVGIIFLGWIYAVANSAGWIHSFDQALISTLASKNASAISFAQHFTVLANTKVMVVLTTLAAIIFWLCKQHNAAYLIASAQILTSGCNLKNTIRRARPTVKHLVSAHGFSFPSGHSCASMALFLSLALVCLLLIKRKPLCICLFILLLIIPLIIGWTRITLHVHFPSDVCGGFLEAIFFTTAAYAFFSNRILQEQINRRKV